VTCNGWTGGGLEGTTLRPSPSNTRGTYETNPKIVWRIYEADSRRHRRRRRDAKREGGALDGHELAIGSVGLRHEAWDLPVGTQVGDAVALEAVAFCSFESKLYSE
jgi:hypothetical protein